MRAMHNPGFQPVDNSPVHNRLFNPQVATTYETSAARVHNILMKRCISHQQWPEVGYPQKVIHLSFIGLSEKLFISLFFFFMLSPTRTFDQAPWGHGRAVAVHHMLYRERLVGN